MLTRNTPTYIRQALLARSRSSVSHNMPLTKTSSLSRRSFSTARIRLALDWSPNTIHSGVFCAVQKGYFKDEGLDCKIKIPNKTDAQENLTPARKVALGHCTFGISTSEAAASFATTEQSTARLVAIAALLQGSTSRICCLPQSGINSPKDLDGRIYATHDGRFEVK